MKLHFLGGAMEIGGSCIYIRAAGKGILLDCGIRQSGSKDPIPDFHTIQQQGGLDAIFISHAHMDHIGTLPVISKAYPQARIYMTAMTADLTRVLLYDSLKIMDQREGEIPHYTEQDVLVMLSRVTPLRYQAAVSLWENVTLTFYPAGHIAGAACIYLVTEEGTLFYSGDFAGFSQRTIEGIRIPKLRPDIAIVESTYGNRLHGNRQVEERRLVELVAECIRQQQKILIPAFALGRAQEVLLILRAAIQNGQIPAVPVYVDGMVRDINTMYTRNPVFLKNSLGKRILKGNEPFYTKEIQPVAPAQRRGDLLKGPEPVILVSSSGMLTGGPSAQYARLLAPSEKGCIIITGYQDEESPGRQLLNLLDEETGEEGGEAGHSVGGRRLVLEGAEVLVNCRVAQVGLSAHGDKSEILALLDRISARHIFLVHGNEDSIQELGREAASGDYRRQVYLPECGQEYEILLLTKRKQLSFELPYTMQKTKDFAEDGEKLLWDYWQAHYPGKRLTVEQIARVWYGKDGAEEEVLQAMQERLLKSVYFSPCARQMFLFEAVSGEAVAQALAQGELTQQELLKRAQECFAAYAYRKIGYHREKKEIQLQFDFPGSLDVEEFEEKAAAFAEQTGFFVSIHPAMNHNAAGTLLYQMFPGRLRKTSYFVEQQVYAVTLSEDQEGDWEAAKEFYKVTGWKLKVNGRFLEDDNEAGVAHGLGGPEKPGHPGEFFPQNPDAQPLEQNLALSCAEQEFMDCPQAPEKKSVKRDGAGRYLELAFISPAIGQRYGEQLQSLANQTGWRIRIADKVNQNALFQIADLLCTRQGISLLKNPSFQPQQKRVMLKTEAEASRLALEAVTAAFVESTGCTCEFI